MNLDCAAMPHVYLVPSLPQVQFDDIFSLRRPRDARAGLSSGLKSIAKGVVGGVAGLVAAPVIGATQQGVTGFAKGVATGGACAPCVLGWAHKKTACVMPMQAHQSRHLGAPRCLQ